ncbi:MAG TPA: PEP-CTERM sorting domain-containing protein [Terriglobales bacterium]|nr:PEP-CTERM sorting domain-containing protein [Terriglobales bacterium]
MARRLFLLFLLVAMAAAAHASKVVVQEPACDSSAIVIDASALTNGFNPIGPVDGGGSYSFCNETGVDWSSLLLVFEVGNELTPADVVCPSYDPIHDPGNTAGLAFSTCVVKSVYSDNIDVELFGTTNPQWGPPVFPGIANGSEFTIDFNCDVDATESNPNPCGPPGKEEWPADTKSLGLPDFNGNIPHLPEPSSLLLLGSGLAAMILRRKR